MWIRLTLIAKWLVLLYCPERKFDTPSLETVIGVAQEKQNTLRALRSLTTRVGDLFVENVAK